MLLIHPYSYNFIDNAYNHDDLSENDNSELWKKYKDSFDTKGFIGRNSKNFHTIQDLEILIYKCVLSSLDKEFKTLIENIEPKQYGLNDNIYSKDI